MKRNTKRPRAIENLEELAEEAHKRATSKYLSTDTRQKWARIEAYIYQTINTLTKTYDSQRITEKMDELYRRVEERARKQEMAQILKQRMTENTLRIPYDRNLLDELNTEKYELTKTGKITLTHPEGTHDDRFRALALAAYAAEQTPPPPTPPIARTT